MTSSYRSTRLVQFDAVPSVSLGLFKLGDSLWTVVEVLRSNRNLFNHVEVTWEDKKAVTSAVLLQVDGYITLVFPFTPSPHPQILQRIDLIITSSPTAHQPNSANIEITYKSHTLHSSQDPLDTKRVSTLFGPTFNDSDQKEDTTTAICYPGIGFEYTRPTSSKRITSANRSSEAHQVNRLAVFQAQHTDHRDNLALMNKGFELEWNFVPNEVMAGTIRECEIKVGPPLPRDHDDNPLAEYLVHIASYDQAGSSATLHFHPSPVSTPREPLEILLHSTTAQDLLLDLGTPSRKFLATDDRFDRLYTSSGGSRANGHVSSQDQRAAEGGKSRPKGCWWNYFHLGLDFLVDDEASGGEVVKIMVHSNIPGTALFQRYARCPWTIASSSTNPPITFRSNLDSISSALSTPTSSSETKRNNEKLTTMSLDRTDEPGLEGVINVGTSRIWAIQGLVMEESEYGGIVGVLVC